VGGSPRNLLPDWNDFLMEVSNPMIRRLAFCVMTPIFLLWLVVPSWAVGPMVSYEGTLADESEQPLSDGRYPIVFSLYESEESEEALWTETQSVNLVDGGYSVLLGGEKPIEIEAQGPLWFEAHQSDEPEGKRTQVLLLTQVPVGTDQIKDKAVTAAKLEEGLGLKLAYNSYSDSSTAEERTEVALKEFTLAANSFSSTLIVEVTGEAHAFEGYLNVYIAGNLEKTMHVRTSEAPWAPYLGGFSGCTIVKRNLDWSKPIEIRVVGYLPVSMPGLDPPQHLTCNSLTVMGS
jgi:hypothetical protein